MTYRRQLDPAAPESPVSRRTVLLAAAAAAAASAPAAGCGRSASVPPLLAADVRRAQPSSDAPVAELGGAMTGFAERLLRASSGARENWIASPLSIAVTFAMARAGAAGSTAAQLDRVFRFPARGVHDAFNAITGELTATDQPPEKLAEWAPGKPPPKPVVSLGNALFTAKGFDVEPSFLRLLAAHYGSGARPVDFTARKATDQINQWVRRQTAGRIAMLFDRLDASTKLVLANAVYFKAYWASPFRSGSAGKEPFTRADATTITAAMMTRSGPCRYASVNGVQAIDLAYGGGPYTMRVMLPAHGGDPVDTLDPATVAAVAGAMTEQQVGVWLPRFDLETHLDLGATLRRLGLTVPFTSGADFSGIAPDLFIDEAVHRANITVDEQGTEAAAATGVGIAVTSGVSVSRTFRADRPFAFMILAGAHSVPIFVGQVHDPTVR